MPSETRMWIVDGVCGIVNSGAEDLRLMNYSGGSLARHNPTRLCLITLPA